MRRRATVLGSLLAAAAPAVFALAAAADCRCPTSTQAPWCRTGGQPIQYTSARGTTFTVTLGSFGGSSDYLCGQYADRTVWVVGNSAGGTPGVVVSSVSPLGSGRDGWEVNPSWNTNHLDSRGTQDSWTAPPALPQTFQGSALPASFVKAVSRESGGTSAVFPCDHDGNRSCLGYVDVLTFVAAVPDSDGDGSTADEFRPGFHGASKPGPYRTDAMDAAVAAHWPQLSAASVAARPTLDECERSQRHPFLEFERFNFSDFEVPLDSAMGPYGKRSYRGGVSLNTAACTLRTLLNDAALQQESPTRSVGRQLLIDVVQRGIDMFGAYRTGRRWNPENGLQQGGWGGHWHGQKIYAAVAAGVLQEPSILSFARSESGPTFFEDHQTWRAGDGRVYFGYRAGGVCSQSFSDNTTYNDQTAVFCAPKNGAGPWDANCATEAEGKVAYPIQYLNIAPGNALMVYAAGLRQAWNDDVWLEWARLAAMGQRGPGHTAGTPYGIYCGPGNKNGRTNWPRGVSSFTSYYRCPFCEAMWTSFASLVGATSGGGGGGPASPPPLPAAPQLLD